LEDDTGRRWNPGFSRQFRDDPDRLKAALQRVNENRRSKGMPARPANNGRENDATLEVSRRPRDGVDAAVGELVDARDDGSFGRRPEREEGETGRRRSRVERRR
jgi:hypothetical protein